MLLPRDNADGALRRRGCRPARPSRRRDAEQPLGCDFALRVDRGAERDRVEELINGDYRGQNASVNKHDQSALGDKPAT